MYILGKNGIACDLYVAGECEKPVPVSEFSGHVERLHADRDKLFEMEYAVSNCKLSPDDGTCTYSKSAK